MPAGQQLARALAVLSCRLGLSDTGSLVTNIVPLWGLWTAHRRQCGPSPVSACPVRLCGLLSRSKNSNDCFSAGRTPGYRGPGRLLPTPPCCWWAAVKKLRRRRPGRPSIPSEQALHVSCGAPWPRRSIGWLLCASHALPPAPELRPSVRWRLVSAALPCESCACFATAVLSGLVLSSCGGDGVQGRSGGDQTDSRFWVCSCCLPAAEGPAAGPLPAGCNARQVIIECMVSIVPAITAGCLQARQRKHHHKQSAFGRFRFQLRCSWPSADQSCAV